MQEDLALVSLHVQLVFAQQLLVLLLLDLRHDVLRLLWGEHSQGVCYLRLPVTCIHLLPVHTWNLQTPVT